MKKLFVAATRQNDGKTMVSLGLFHAILRRITKPKLAYIKPVGQQYKLIDGEKIDKDAVLFQKVYDLTDPFKYMSPIAVPSGFTKQYINAPHLDQLKASLLHAQEQLAHGREFFLIEGTGHAGVGSVFDLSNAAVAKLMGAKVVLISQGGIGRAIDEIMLNKAVFELMGAEILGVILNKVKKDKYDQMRPYVEKGLQRHNLKLYGMIPFVDMLIRPCVASIFEKFESSILAGEENILNTVTQCVIGDMVPHDALSHLSRHTMLIVPANREGLIMTMLSNSIFKESRDPFLSGIIFTGGKKPHDRIVEILQKTHTPSICVSDDSFTVATRINNLLVKVRADEPEKIEKAQFLVEKYVDVDGLCNAL